MGWWIALAVLILLALIPLGVRLRYDAAGFVVMLIIGPIKLRVFPSKPKETRKAEEVKPIQQKPKKKDIGKQKKQSGGSITDFLPLVRIALDFLNGFRKKLRIDHLQLKLILGGGDPCDLALNYGKGWAVLGDLLPLLEQVFMIGKRDLEVECDFTADQTTILAGADLTMRLWQLISLLLVYGPRAIKEYKSIMKIRKGGANT